jgi:hypothetical protein
MFNTTILRIADLHRYRIDAPKSPGDEPLKTIASQRQENSPAGKKS